MGGGGGSLKALRPTRKKIEICQSARLAKRVTATSYEATMAYKINFYFLKVVEKLSSDLYGSTFNPTQFEVNSPEWNLAMINFLIKMKEQGYDVNTIKANKVALYM